MSEQALLFGIPVQIDLGNLAVGLGTTFVAIVSFWATRTQYMIQSKKNLADLYFQRISQIKSTAIDLNVSLNNVTDIVFEFSLEFGDISLSDLSENEKFSAAFLRFRSTVDEARIASNRLASLLSHSSIQRSRERDSLEEYLGSFEKSIQPALSSEIMLSEVGKISKSYRQGFEACTSDLINKEWSKIEALLG